MLLIGFTTRQNLRTTLYCRLLIISFVHVWLTESGQRFACRRRISLVSGSASHGCIDHVTSNNYNNYNDVGGPATAYTSRRRHSTAARPVHQLSRQLQHITHSQHHHHQHHYQSGPPTRTFSVQTPDVVDDTDEVEPNSGSLVRWSTSQNLIGFCSAITKNHRSHNS